MMMNNDFEHVPKEEWEPIRGELFKIIHRLRKMKLGNNLIFNIISYGSSKRKDDNL